MDAAQRNHTIKYQLVIAVMEQRKMITIIIIKMMMIMITIIIVTCLQPW